MTAPEVVSELNSFVIHSRHPELVFVILNLFQDLLNNGSNAIQEMLTCVSMTAFGITAPELVSELNSFVIHSRHPELVFVTLNLFPSS